MTSKKKLILPCTIFLLVGIVFVIAGIIAIKQGDSLKARCTEETTGTVVGVICERDSGTTDFADSSYTYYPVIEYQAGERTISQKSRSGQTPPKYKVGDKVTVYYNPNNVEEYIIKGDSTPQYLGIVFIVIGSLAAAGALFAFIRNASKSDKSSDSDYYHTNIDS